MPNFMFSAFGTELKSYSDKLWYAVAIIVVIKGVINVGFIKGTDYMDFTVASHNCISTYCAY